MIDSALSWSFRIMFVVFVAALIFSVAFGLYIVWNPNELTELRTLGEIVDYVGAVGKKKS